MQYQNIHDTWSIDVERTFLQVLAALEELKSREEECRAAHELVPFYFTALLFFLFSIHLANFLFIKPAIFLFSEAANFLLS